MFLPVTQPNVIVLVLPQHCSFTYEQCCNTARLHKSSVFPSKLKLNTDPEAEPYGIHRSTDVTQGSSQTLDREAKFGSLHSYRTTVHHIFTRMSFRKCAESTKTNTDSFTQLYCMLRSWHLLVSSFISFQFDARLL